MNLIIIQRMSEGAIGAAVIAVLVVVLLLIIVLRKEVRMGQALDNLNANVSKLGTNVTTLDGTVAAAVAKLGQPPTTTGEDPVAVQAAADQVSSLNDAVVKANNTLGAAVTPPPPPTPTPAPPAV